MTTEVSDIPLQQQRQTQEEKSRLDRIEDIPSSSADISNKPSSPDPPRQRKNAGSTGKMTELVLKNLRHDAS
jgi:hypothetical protein